VEERLVVDAVDPGVDDAHGSVRTLDLHRQRARAIEVGDDGLHVVDQDLTFLSVAEAFAGAAQ